MSDLSISDSQKKITITPSQLCKGMYVILPKSWIDHPFLLNRFLINSENQLIKLRECGLKEIIVDLEKSQLPVERLPNNPSTQDRKTEEPIDPREIDDLPEWAPETLIPEQLLEALHATKISPEKRAAAVYTHSREMMKRLLESPTAKNLRVSKKVIGSITDLLLSDDLVASNMLHITSHDFYTYTHSINVGVTSIMLSKALLGNSDAHDMHEVAAGFFLHDLGKVNIRPDVINKPGRLTEDEMQHMRTHPYKGYKLLKDLGEITEEARVIILQHHERADGSGYPKQLKGNRIHVYAKICSIADVFDALTAERSYKKGLSSFEALRLMKIKMAGQFDKDLFGAFVRLWH